MSAQNKNQKTTGSYKTRSESLSIGKIRVQRILSIAAVSLITFVGLETLVYINNLYQQSIYIKLSFFIYAILLFWLYFVFDLHFKLERDPLHTFARAMSHRISHFLSWKNFRHFQSYLILPGIIYWSTIILIGINFGHRGVQQFLAVCSGLSLVIVYALFKEIFKNRFAPAQSSHFLALSYVKLYAAWIVFAASLGIVWYYCFSPHIFYLVIYLSSFMLLYQALFQIGKLGGKNILIVFGVSLLLTIVSYFVYTNWNVNYFSAGLFIAAIYNFCWFMTYNSVNKTLTKAIIIEQLIVLALIIVMVFGVTDFKAKIDRCI